MSPRQGMSAEFAYKVHEDPRVENTDVVETLMIVSATFRVSFSSLSAFLAGEGRGARDEEAECVYLTEIELSLAAEQRDENENEFTGVYSLPAIKAQEIALARPFNSRIVK